MTETYGLFEVAFYSTNVNSHLEKTFEKKTSSSFDDVTWFVSARTKNNWQFVQCSSVYNSYRLWVTHFSKQQILKTFEVYLEWIFQHDFGMTNEYCSKKKAVERQLEQLIIVTQNRASRLEPEPNLVERRWMSRTVQFIFLADLDHDL